MKNKRKVVDKRTTTNSPRVNENPLGDPNVPSHYNHAQLAQDRKAVNTGRKR